jgi:hypothetical protein
MPFKDALQRTRAMEAEREWRKFMNKFDKLVKDMTEVKARLDRLERQSGQSEVEAEHPPLFDSDEQ